MLFFRHLKFVNICDTFSEAILRKIIFFYQKDFFVEMSKNYLLCWKVIFYVACVYVLYTIIDILCFDQRCWLSAINQKMEKNI